MSSISSQPKEQTAGSVFTAAQIAACLGVTPQAVRKALRGIEAASIKMVAGLETAAWLFNQLPEKLQLRLQEEAGKRRYRNAQIMLSSPPIVWKPALSLTNICSEDIEAARKLQAALRPWLAQQHTLDLSASEIERRGVIDYGRAFGHSISSRYWRELFMRTLRRDGGAEDWGRLEIYLPEKITPKAGPCKVVLEALVGEFAGLDSFIASCSNPAEPTEAERRGLWTLAIDEYAKLVASTPPKRAARRIRDYLFARAAFLAPSREALLKAFQRKLAALENAGGDPKSLHDGREQNGDRFELPGEDRDLLIHRAVFYYRGDIAPAWRDCLAKGFSEDVRRRYSSAVTRKSYVPVSVMESVSPEVEILTVMYQGKRAFDSIKGHVNRSYEGIHSLVCMSADDFTMPVYFYVPDGNGWFTLTRGQILLFIDFRSLRIIGWSMQPDRNYSSLTIRSLCTHVFAEFGIPDVLQFERGIWESSLLLKGRETPLRFTEVAQGLREFGIHFIHSIRPRSKVVERVGGLMQDLMEGEPGYCGRDERRDSPEILQKHKLAVEARRMHPGECFYDAAAWNRRFGELVNQYNATPQQGKILRGLSPDKALAEFANPDDPPMQLPAEVRYLLAHDKRSTVVTLDGVKFQVGKKLFKYRGSQIAHQVGREVMVWFDPENPESVVVTDMQRRNHICVPRAEEPSALECLISPDSGTLAREMQRIEDQASYMKTRFQAVKSKYPLPQRKLLADAKTLELGRTIESQRQANAEQKTEKTARVSAMRRKAQRMGISPVLLDDTVEHQEGIDLIEAARRQHQRGRTYVLDPSKEMEQPQSDGHEGAEQI